MLEEQELGHCDYSGVNEDKGNRMYTGNPQYLLTITFLKMRAKYQISSLVDCFGKVLFKINSYDDSNKSYYPSGFMADIIMA